MNKKIQWQELANNGMGWLVKLWSSNYRSYSGRGWTAIYCLRWRQILALMCRLYVWMDRWLFQFHDYPSTGQGNVAIRSSRGQTAGLKPSLHYLYSLCTLYKPRFAHLKNDANYVVTSRCLKLKEIIHDKYITKTNCALTICSMRLFNIKILDNVYYKEKELGRPF